MISSTPTDAPSVASLLGIGIALLKLVEIGIHAVEAFVPEAAITFDPACHLLERPRFEPRRPPLRIAPAADQPCLLQHLQMPGDGRQADVEGRGEAGDRSL